MWRELLDLFWEVSDECILVPNIWDCVLGYCVFLQRINVWGKKFLRIKFYEIELFHSCAFLLQWNRQIPHLRFCAHKVFLQLQLLNKNLFRLNEMVFSIKFRKNGSILSQNILTSYHSFHFIMHKFLDCFLQKTWV